MDEERNPELTEEVGEAELLPPRELMSLINPQPIGVDPIDLLPPGRTPADETT